MLCYDPHCTEGAAASDDVKFIDLRDRSAPPVARHLRKHVGPLTNIFFCLFFHLLLFLSLFFFSSASPIPPPRSEQLRHDTANDFQKIALHSGETETTFFLKTAQRDVVL